MSEEHPLSLYSKAFPLKMLDTSVIKTLDSRNQDDQRLAELSVRNYTMVADEFNHYLTENGLSLSIPSILSYFEEVKAVAAPATYNLKRQALKKVLKAQKEIKGNIVLIAVVNELFSHIKRIRADHAVYKDKYLSLEEVKALIAICPLKTGTIVEFLFKTGLRISESLSIRLQDIEVAQSVRIRVVGKGSKQRFVFIDRDFYYRLIHLWQPQVYLFESASHHPLHRVNVSESISRYGAMLGKKISAHTLRHSCIMHLLQFKNIKYVSKYAGHSSSAITADMYVHENPDEEVIDFFDLDD